MYDEFRKLKLDFWPALQFDWTVSDHVTHKPLQRSLFAGDSDAEYLFDLWHARRIAYRRNFMPGVYGSDITLANWPQMDYWLKPVIGVSNEERVVALEEARQFSLSFLYWIQTEAARHDGGYGYRGLRLRGDVLGTTDGLAKQAYYREGRRIRSEFTILEQHVGVEARAGFSSAEKFFDSVASVPIASICIPAHRVCVTRWTSTVTRLKFHSVRCCRFESIIFYRHARTSAPRELPTARTGFIPSSGASARRLVRSRASR